MGLFDRLNQAFSAATTAFNEPTEKKTVATLNFNLANPVELSEDVLPMTVKEALEQYEDDLGIDASRITTVTVNKVKAEMDYVIKSGDEVRFLITSEGKG